MWKTRIPYRLIDFSARIHPKGKWVVGVKRLSDIGGSGSWVWIDENDNVVEVEDGYFADHPSFQFIEQSDEHGNEFVSIPKFYVKSDGNSRYWISPEPRDGFHVHPAFMSKGKEISDIVTDIHGNDRDEARIWIGKWQSWIDYDLLMSGRTRMWSVSGLSDAAIAVLEERHTEDITEEMRDGWKHLRPTTHSTYWQNWHAAENWNDREEDGPVTIQGYHMMNVWEWSALQWLALIEGCTTDVTRKFGPGHMNGTQVHPVNGDLVVSADFHGIYGLWGNVWQWIEGVQSRYDGSIWIWDNIGNKIWKDTGHKMPMRRSDTELWSPGETYGYWRSRLVTAGWNYDTADMFLPDTSSFVSDYGHGCFSDAVWCRTRTASSQLCGCAVGGPYDAGDWCGMFGWNFNLRIGNERMNNGYLIEDYMWTYSNVASRLCFAPVNLPEGTTGNEDDEESNAEQTVSGGAG